jgi:hypothetical protein
MTRKAIMSDQTTTETPTQDVPVTEADILARGYRPYRDSMKSGQFYTGNWYLRIVDDVGIRYSINITGYEFPGQTVRYSANAQLHEQHRFDGSVFNVERYVSAGLEEIEAFFDKLWTSMKLDYYERRNADGSFD